MVGELPSAVEADVCGPYSWLRSSVNDAPWLFTAPDAKKTGVYLWAVPFQDATLVCWVGFTTNRFGARFRTHTREYLAGTYSILDTEALLAGRRQEVWHGMWYGRSSIERVEEYLSRAGDLGASTRTLLQTFRVYLIPLPPIRRLQARLEAGIVSSLYNAPAGIAAILDKGYHLEPRMSEEPPIDVQLRGGPEFHGLARRLVV